MRAAVVALFCIGTILLINTMVDVPWISLPLVIVIGGIVYYRVKVLKR